jgi:hypothetical protein
MVAKYINADPRRRTTAEIAIRRRMNWSTGEETFLREPPAWWLVTEAD